MAYNIRVQSISDLNKKLKVILYIVTIAILALTLSIALAAFYSYQDKDKTLAIHHLNMQLAKFSSNYEHRIISIASQPIFRNLLGADLDIIKDFDSKNPFMYGLKRQIASFTAKYQKQSIFEGSVIYNDKNSPVFSQGRLKSPYHITIDLCYRDAILSYKKGIPCIGSWTFYISEKKLLTILNKNFSLTEKASDSIPLNNLFQFDNIKVLTKNLPSQLFFKLKLNFGAFFYYIIAAISLIFLAMLGLVLLVMKIYRQVYFEPFADIHHHMETGNVIAEDNYLHSPKEVIDFIIAINKALKNRKLEAIAHLAHDLKPPLEQIKNLALLIEHPVKQQLLNIHTQISLAIHKMHHEDIDNLDLKKVIHDCVNSFYNELMVKGNLTVELGETSLFCRASYSHLIRVISNLINNAKTATRECANPQIHLLAYSENYTLFLKVLDNGCGIAQEQQAHIFQDAISYFGSSGKGLSYCKTNIEHWNGKIKCQSEVGKGTVFEVQLPEAKAPFDFINRLFFNKRSRLVLVDDESCFHEDLKQLCPDRLPIKHIFNPKEWLEYLENDFSQDDFFVMDYQCSETVTGLEMIQEAQLLGKAYLVSSVADFIRESKTSIRNDLPILSKNQIKSIQFEDIDGYDCVLVDDDLEVLSDAFELAQMKGKSLLCLNNFLQLNMILSMLVKDIPITLDNNIDNLALTGIQIAALLKKEGFTRVAIQSGDQFEPLIPHVDEVLSKGGCLYE